MHFVEILVRQAHPGPAVPPYRTITQKLQDAAAYQRVEAIPWQVLVDDLAGTTHQVYGGLSDPIYLIDTEGRVAFYNMFANAPAVHQALTDLFAQGGRGVVRGGVDRFPHLGAALTNGWPALRRGLPQSVLDLMVATPGSPLPVWLGWQVRQLLAPLTLRSHPLPLPVKGALLALPALLAGVLLLLRRQAGATMPTRKREAELPDVHGRPPTLPKKAQRGSKPLQLTEDGSGPLFHRCYRADIAQPSGTRMALMRRIQGDPNTFSPPALARFEKIKGTLETMRVGDEYHIHITGPWDGPVRVSRVEPTAFALVTLEGHVEAGEIVMQLNPHPTRANAWRFEIHSWARSRDTVVDMLYSKLPLVKQAQTNMWLHFCQRVVEESGGELIGKIDVFTERAPYRGEVVGYE